MDFLRIYNKLEVAVKKSLLSQGLRAKVMRGGAWLGAGSFAEQVTRFARNILLARLLAPSAFGTMAIVFSCQSLIASFADVGLWPAIIHNPRGAEKAYLNAAWWLGFGRSVGIYLIIFAAAPFVAHFYGNADLSVLLRVTFVSTIIDGMSSPRAILAHKEMKFDRCAIITHGGNISGVLLTIILSFVLRDVWALAIGYCGENAFRCILSYIVCPGLPSLKWDMHAIRDLLKFSRGMFGLSFLKLIFSRTDVFVLGKLVSPTELGIYILAVNLVQTPTYFLINILAQTLLPAFSHIQSERERVNRILTEMTSWVILLGLPVVVVIWLCGPSLLTVAYGARYAAAASALAVAGGVMLVNVLDSFITGLFLATGRPSLHRRAALTSAITMMIVIYPACKGLGLVGGQVASLIATAASYALQVVRARELMGLTFRYTKAFITAALVSAGIVVAYAGVHSLGVAINPLANIVIAAVACIAAYVLYVPIFAKTRETA